MPELDDADAIVRRRFLNPADACECRPTHCVHSFYWPTSGVVEHRPGAVVEVSMPASQPCPQGLVELVDDEPTDAPAGDESAATPARKRRSTPVREVEDSPITEVEYLPIAEEA